MGSPALRLPFAAGLLVSAFARSFAAPAPPPVAISPEDAVIRRVLDLVERTHLHQGGTSPEGMLVGALEAIRRGNPGIDWTWDEGRLVVTLDGRGRDLRVPGTGPLPLALAPSLEDLLELLAPAAAEGGPPGRDRDAVRAALLDGALRTLDRWSSASTGDRRARLVGRFRGESVGVGLRLGRRDGSLRVLGVVPGSGAEEAGIAAGDVLVAVGCTPVAGLTVARVIELLRGAAGSEVALVLERTAPESVTVVRKAIETGTVATAWAQGGVAVLRIDHLSKRTGAQAQAAVAALRRATAPRAIVMDLRGNTGGSMLAAAAVADLFVDAGVLVEALDAADRPVPGLRSRVDATTGGDVDTPLAVLVDRRTGSSAELLAAALAWSDRAILVGERTFGKNVVGKLHQFDDCDLTVKLTSATLRAAGRPLPGDGLVPDVAAGSPSLPAGMAGPDVVEAVAGLLLAHGRPSRGATLQSLAGLAP